MMWTSQEIIDATGGTLKGSPFTVDSVAIDSRKLEAGALFVALKGERFDGHEYVKQSFKNGAGAALVSNMSQGSDTGSCILVPDVYEALLAMAKVARGRTRARIIAVTGSVGKTGTKEAIRMAAMSAGKVYATYGNLNNHIGLPLSLCNLPRDADFGVFELGMNHAGEISFLTKLARPDVAVITNVEEVHLEFFADVTAIASAKAEIFEGVAPEGGVVLNHDNGAYEQLVQAAKARGIGRIVSFGEHEACDCRLTGYKIENMGSLIEAQIFTVPVMYRLGTTGRHWALSSLAALAAVTMAGTDLANSAAALEHFHEPEGRGRLLRLATPAGSVLIDDCYNASPTSMKGALSKLAELSLAQENRGRKVAVLGDMLELGGTAAELHRGLLRSLQANAVDKVYAAGPLMKYLYDMLPSSMQGAWAADAKQLAGKMDNVLQPHDLVLIKGSRGSRMDIVRDTLQNAASHISTKESANAL